MYRFRLPQAEIDFTRDVPVRQILVLGGRPPETAWLREASKGKTVWAADSGAEACRVADIPPSRVLGDFDSIGEEGRKWLERLDIRPELYPADKDYTDFQLCLNRIRGGLLVTGCWGRRFDHTFGNIFSVLWGREQGVDIQAFADETEVMVPLFGGNEAEFFFRAPPAAVSLLPLTAECEGVCIEGVKWELRDAKLPQEFPWALSNIPLDNSPRGRGESNGNMKVRLRKGALGVYCLFGDLRGESATMHKIRMKNSA